MSANPRASLIFWTAILLSILLSASAGAVTYTLSETVFLTGSEPGNPGVIGQIDPVTDLGGSILMSDGDVLDPTGVLQDVFVVDVRIDAGTVDQLGISVMTTSFTPTGAGSFDDLGREPTTGVALDLLNGGGLFDFTLLEGGETSVRLYVSYAPGTIMNLFPNDVNFMISGGTNFTVQGTTVVPEPGAAFLLGAFAGLGLLALRRRVGR